MGGGLEAWWGSEDGVLRVWCGLVMEVRGCEHFWVGLGFGTGEEGDGGGGGGGGG